MTRNKTKYESNFTSAGLLYHEFIALQNVLLSPNFSVLMQSEQKDNQYLGIATQTGRKRAIHEIKRRYSNAPSGFWQQFFEWDIQEQKLGLFFLILKTYPIIFELHWNVTLNKFRTGDNLDSYDLTMKFDELSSNNEIIDSWANSTINKLNTRYRRALTEVGMLKNKALQKPPVNKPLYWDYYKNISEAWFLEACFQKN
ncbi:BrxA family protein [Marinifilum sp. RC60d5]|uniref:BrxA family protein n=1 Tax=Marinifilum sp. RC60d5 TaxID=3458414 RepID=UPI00403570DC